MIKVGTDIDSGPVIPSFHIPNIARKAAVEITTWKYCRFRNVHAILEGKPYDIVDPTPAITIETLFKTKAKLNAAEIAEISATNKTELKDFMTFSKSLNDMTTKCIMCFEKIAPMLTTFVRELLGIL